MPAEINIGLDDEQRSSVVKILSGRLADIYVLYTKTRKYHWNVTGMQFAELHEFFEEQYTEMEAMMDETAERIRQLGAMSPGTLEEFKGMTNIAEKPGVNPAAQDMVADLLNDHEIVIRQLREGADSAEQLRDMGTNDFLIGLMEKHEKMAWMLRAHLEG